MTATPVRLPLTSSWEWGCAPTHPYGQPGFPTGWKLLK